MNRDELEQKLLLETTGELPAAERESLAAWLRTHPDDAAWCAATRRLLDAARNATPLDAAPGAAVRANLRAVATARAHAPALVFPPVWLRGLAYAAALVLAVAAWLWMTPRGNHDRVAEMHAIVAATRAEETDAAAAGVTHAANGETEEARLRALARALLEMEGLALDEETADAEDAWDELSPTVEPSPTVLQPRSTRGPAAKTYG